MAKGITSYSKYIPGSPANYNWKVRFDNTDGFVGISQFCDIDTDVPQKSIERVLLSPAQYRSLLEFAGKPRRSRAKR